MTNHPKTIARADDDSIDDAGNVYGDGLTFNIDDVIELCANSPSGQCEYSISDGFRCCIHCGEDSGL